MEHSNSKNDKKDTPQVMSHTKDQTSEDLTIFVGGLASTCTASQLHTYFSTFGTISSCEPQTWKKGGSKCRGFALVHCADRTTHKSVLSQKRHVFDDRVIECKRWFASKKKLEEYNTSLKMRKVFVGGLPSHFKSFDLEVFFQEQVGDIDIAYIITQHRTGRSKGFGYVVFEKVEDRDKALEIRHFAVGRKKITVSEYSEKKGKAKGKMPKPKAAKGGSKTSQGKKQSKDGQEERGKKRRKQRARRERQVLDLTQSSNDGKSRLDPSGTSTSAHTPAKVSDSGSERKEANTGVSDVEGRQVKLLLDETALDTSQSPKPGHAIADLKNMNRRAYSLFGKFKNRFLFRKFELSKLK